MILTLFFVITFVFIGLYYINISPKSDLLLFRDDDDFKSHTEKNVIDDDKLVAVPYQVFTRKNGELTKDYQGVNLLVEK